MDGRFVGAAGSLRSSQRRGQETRAERGRHAIDWRSAVDALFTEMGTTKRRR